jgi:PII-like signaling protein
LQKPGAVLGFEKADAQEAGMEPLHEAMLLRAFVGVADRASGHAIYGAIVEAARTAGLAGATVFHGPLGFGHRRHLNWAMHVDAVDNLPAIVEIIDSEERVLSFLPQLDPLIPSGLVTLERVRAAHIGRLYKTLPTETKSDWNVKAQRP